MRLHVLSALVLGCMAAAVTGCGWFAKEATEKAIEMSASADGEDVDVELDGSSMKFKSEDGDVSMNFEDNSGQFEMTNEEGTFKMTTGENAQIPDNFPKDIPLYPGFKPDYVSSLPDGGFSLAGAVPAAIPAIKAHYDQEAKKSGWTETGSIAEQHVASLTYEKEKRMLQVTATPDAKGTMISITTMTN